MESTTAAAKAELIVSDWNNNRHDSSIVCKTATTRNKTQDEVAATVVVKWIVGNKSIIIKHTMVCTQQQGT